MTNYINKHNAVSDLLDNKVLIFHKLTIPRLLRFLNAQTTHLVLLVVRVRTLEAEYIAVTLECNDMSTDTVEEPTVVADYNCTACEVLKTLLKCTQCVHVNVVGRLVK